MLIQHLLTEIIYLLSYTNRTKSVTFMFFKLPVPLTIWDCKLFGILVVPINFVILVDVNVLS